MVSGLALPRTIVLMSAGSLAADPEMVRRVGRRLAHWRTQTGLTQGEVAERLGRSQSVVAKIEAGRRAVGFLETLVLCDLYGQTQLRLDPREPDDTY